MITSEAAAVCRAPDKPLRAEKLARTLKEPADRRESAPIMNVLFAPIRDDPRTLKKRLTL
jgi:hypothetical protein